uniref:Uncharacterized protein n=1 Tax=Lepeophtheirus salmonis TaxID=72036 RepID=A0A0K2SZH6_LEPSM
MISHIIILSCLVLLLFQIVSSHHTWFYGDGIQHGETSSKELGIFISFEAPVYTNGYFIGFDGWDKENEAYGYENITWIVRVEFKRESYRENKMLRHHRRFWLPGVKWVELSERTLYTHRTNLSLARRKTQSHLDIWVEPVCFLKHNGIARIYRISKTLKLDVEHLRWLAKINYKENENYHERELIELSKKMSQVKGIQCAWLHPRGEPGESLMIRFFKGEIPQKDFFSPKGGYHNWSFLNNEYQAIGIHYLRGWNRALLDFETGLHCRENMPQISDRYQGLPGVRFVYTDSMKECRFAYQIVLAFDRRSLTVERLSSYHHWNNLNHIYGVVQVSYELIEDYKTVLEFEPGLYTHHQMKAIRDEYLKLPGIRFGWVLGKKAKEVSTIILNFNPLFLRKRLSLKNYRHWEHLNKRYAAIISILDESKSRAYIRFPEGRFSDLELKAILRKYRQLPGIVSVRMDKQQRQMPSYWRKKKKMNETTSSRGHSSNNTRLSSTHKNKEYLLTHSKKRRHKKKKKKRKKPQTSSRRSIKSWLRLSHGNVRSIGHKDDWKQENKILFQNRDVNWSSRCIIE